MDHPCCDTMARPLDFECVKMLWCVIVVGLFLVRSGSLVLRNGILKSLTKLKARADGDGLAIVFVQISQRSVRLGFEGAVVLWDADLNDSMACLTIEVATELRCQLCFQLWR